MCKKFYEGLKCLKAKCTHKAMFITNIVAVAIIWVCIILRIVAYHKSRMDNDHRTSTGVSIVLMTPFQLGFSILLLLAEIRKYLIVRKFLNFLDSNRGRGCFLIFITLTLLDHGSILAIFLCIALLIIGILNIFLFLYESSDGILDINLKDLSESSPKQKKSQSGVE
jgi:hypothetical protein